MGETAPFWIFSAASYPDLAGITPIEAIPKNDRNQVNGKPNNGSLFPVSEVYIHWFIVYHVVYFPFFLYHGL